MIHMPHLHASYSELDIRVSHLMKLQHDIPIGQEILPIRTECLGTRIHLRNEEGRHTQAFKETKKLEQLLSGIIQFDERIEGGK